MLVDAEDKLFLMMSIDKGNFDESVANLFHYLSQYLIV